MIDSHGFCDAGEEPHPFGIARVRDLSSGDKFATTSGALLGTPAFMAPEQAGGWASQIDARTDLWAAGASMFTLLSGETVHDGETVQQLIVRAATEQARSLGLAFPGMDAGLVAIVDRALAFDKNARWPSADSMRTAMREACRAWWSDGVGRIDLVALAGSEGARPPPSLNLDGNMLRSQENGYAVARAAHDATPPRIPARTAAPVARSMPAPAAAPTQPSTPIRGARRLVIGLGTVAALIAAGRWMSFRLGPRAGVSANPPVGSVVSVASAVPLPSATLGALDEGPIPTPSIVPTQAPAPPEPVSSGAIAAPPAYRQLRLPKSIADASPAKHDVKDNAGDWDRP